MQRRAKYATRLEERPMAAWFALEAGMNREQLQMSHHNLQRLA